MMTNIFAADADEELQRLEQEEQQKQQETVIRKDEDDDETMEHYYEDGENDQDDDDDSRHTYQTASSPLVLEPLGMSISFDDQVAVAVAEPIVPSCVQHGSATARVLDYANGEDMANHYRHHDDDNSSATPNNDLYVWWVLWRAPILVYTCLFVVPTISSFVMKEETLQQVQDCVHAVQQLLQNGMDYVHQYQSSWCCRPGKDAGSCMSQAKAWVQSTMVDPALEYICNLDHGNAIYVWNVDDLVQHAMTTCSSSSSTSSWCGSNIMSAATSYWARRWNLCPPLVAMVEEEEPVIIYRSVLDPHLQTEWKHDLLLVAAFSATLTLLRLVSLFLATLALKVGSFSSSRSNKSNASMTKQPDGDETNELESSSLSSDPRHPLVLSSPPSSRTKTATAGEHHLDTTMTSSATATTLLEEESSFESLPGSAFFRTVCCTTFAALACIHFHNATFWPQLQVPVRLQPFLFGNSSNEELHENGDDRHYLDHCWDFIVPVDDPDDVVYEEENALLRMYVLVQASYYVHSVLFRLLRWLCLGRKRRTSLVLSLIQSILALGLLGLAYGFSSLRRLMTLGMVALDVSSAIRYFWQWCAPGASAVTSTRCMMRARKVLSHLLYWTLVLPSFVATRFYLYPLLWQSATNAKEWQLHLEEALWKGSAEQFERLCNACMALLVLVSLFSFQRLIDAGPYYRPNRHARLSQKPVVK